MKKAIIIVVALVVVLVGAVVAAPFFVPTGVIVAQISDAVKSSTGRTLTMGDDVGLTLFPSVGVTASNVAFGNAPGSAEANMATLDGLEVQLKVLPLLTGEVEIERFVLVKPVIRLEIDKQGRPNWVFGEAKPATSGESASGGGSSVALGDLRLGDVRLTDGQVFYSDARTGVAEEVRNVNLTISLPALSQPLKAEGDLVWHDKKIDLDVALEKPDAFLDGAVSPASVAVDGEPLALKFAGSLANPGGIKVDGDLSLDVPSVRGLAAWAGSPIDMPGDTLGPLSIKGTVAVDGAVYGVKDADIKLDAITAKGSFSADTGGAKPYLKGQLAVGDLDVNPYLPAETQGGGTAAGTPADSNAGSEGWSEEPMDFSGLKAANLDFDLSVDSILIRKIQIGKGALALKLKDGVFTADLKELALYEGKGSGSVTLDGSGKVPSLKKSFTLEGVQAQPLLTDAAGFDRLAGTAKADYAITAQGASQMDMVKNLNGKGAVKFENGAIVGINLAAMVRNVSTAFLDQSAGETQKTDFSELSGTFTIANGLLKNDDLSLQSPLLRINGAGTSDLPARTVDYRVEPKFAATLEGQGGEQKVAGVMVPVIVSGPWDNLSYKPDLASLVKDPSKVMDAVKDLKSGKPADKLKALIPGAAKPSDASPSESGAAPAPSADPLGAVKGLLGGKK